MAITPFVSRLVTETASWVLPSILATWTPFVVVQRIVPS